MLTRWLLGTHAGAVGDMHLQAHLDEKAFAARVIEQLVTHAPLPMREINDGRRYRFAPPRAAVIPELSA
jgi:hypothetical protein